MSRISVTCALLVLLGSIGLCACGGSASPSPSTSSSPARNLFKYAWAVGRHGTILATTDGGTHWKVQKAGTVYDLSAVAFADTAHGWAVGARRNAAGVTNSVILRTRDGGRDWTTLRSLTTTSLYDIACVGASGVWVVGQASDGKGLILVSSDGGANWQEQQLDLADEAVRRVAFADARHGWAATMSMAPNAVNGRILKTSDGGVHWQVGEALPMSIEGIAPAGADRCWAAGMVTGEGDLGRLLVADEQGIRWKKAPGSGAPLEGVVAVGESRVGVFGTGMMDGAFGAFLARSDDGEHWTASKIPGDLAPITVVYSDASHGWAVGLAGRGTTAHPNYGVILTTTDGGATWRKSSFRSDTRQLWDVACLPANGGADSGQ